MQPAPFSHFPTILAIFREIMARRLPQALVGSDALTVQTFGKDFFLKSRLYMVKDSLHMSQEWNRIRASAALVDLIMGATADLSMMLARSEVTFDRLVEDFVEANSRNRPKTSQVTVTGLDQDFFERLPAREELKSLYESNPWFITLLLLEMQGPGYLTNFQMPDQRPVPRPAQQ